MFELFEYHKRSVQAKKHYPVDSLTGGFSMKMLSRGLRIAVTGILCLMRFPMTRMAR